MILNLSWKCSPESRWERRMGRVAVLVLCGVVWEVGSARSQGVQEVTLAEALALARENAPALEQRQS
ncbi:MAG: hypothetical protein P8049_05700, partial [Gemmatimonadota bacterium]